MVADMVADCQAIQSRAVELTSKVLILITPDFALKEILADSTAETMKNKASDRPA
jgi:hypothetical protein